MVLQVINMRKREKREDLYELIAGNIRKYRKERKLTQAKLAEMTGYSHEYIRRIEATKTKKYFSLDTVGHIADALEVNVKELLNVDNSDEKK